MRTLFRILRVWGDAKAISGGRYHKRLWNRMIIKQALKLLRWR